MKISELIEHLKDIKSHCGDLKVEIYSAPLGKEDYISLDKEFFTVDRINNKLQLG